ncbi:MAG TPA: GAF domain-containing protein, partial [Vicinamibacteria bacterium]|nr:GAF domain-containing protein [Vicinamibacteria bacterium]
METTDTVIEGRRLRLLNALAEGQRAGTPQEACAHAASEMARATGDIPFALLYLLDESGAARLAGAAHLVPGSAWAPTTVRAGETAPWPFADVKDEPLTIPLPDGVAGARGAAILPIAGGGQRFGFVVTGLSPMLSESHSYTRFHTLLAASISQGVSSAVAYQEERKRL